LKTIHWTTPDGLFKPPKPIEGSVGGVRNEQTGPEQPDDREPVLHADEEPDPEGSEEEVVQMSVRRRILELRSVYEDVVDDSFLEELFNERNAATA
jgi:hypothetical protein